MCPASQERPGDGLNGSFERRVARARELLRSARRVAAFTGAGISTESGIPDFRSPGGVWDRHRMVTYDEFISSESARREYWSMKRELIPELSRAQPNRAHFALAEMERRGKLRCLITQNIDGLHQDAGSGHGTVIEIHGTNRRATCLDCAAGWPIEQVQVQLEAGEEIPRCRNCGGLVKPATVMFGEAMPQAEMRRAIECCVNSDLLFMIGSSLQVEPAASLPRTAWETGSRLIFINRSETPWDHIADVRFSESAGEVMEGILVAGANGEAP